MPRTPTQEELQQVTSDSLSTTPIEITPNVAKFCERLNGKPIWVPVESCDGPLNECFAITQQRVARDGGQMEVGWAIWEWQTIMIEAEHHAIWIDPRGRRVDISPKKRGERRILFVPDPSTPFRKGKRTDNRRSPLRKDQRIHDFIKIALKIMKLTAGDIVGGYRVTEELAQCFEHQFELQIKLRAMTDRKLVDAARAAACVPMEAGTAT